jgi:nicotinate-nucleotide pyrophosphorylase (carboxylating)
MTLPHDRSGLLIDDRVPSEIFSQSMDRWIETMLADDVSEEGGTNNFVRGKLIAKEKGVICGQIVVNRMLEKHAPNCSYDWKVSEGELVKEREHILQISGASSEILKVERVMLNLLGRLSGISTTTSEWVSDSNDLQLACTRKTEWGILDKWAVHIGGGLTHRLFRSDALMLKENDFASAIESGESQNDSIKKLISEIDLEKNSKFTVIEVQNINEAILAAQTWSEKQRENSTTDSVVLLLDNMGPMNARVVVTELEKLDLRKWCILEGSGGITKDSISEWSSSGVDLISTSAMNRGVKPLDISLIIEGEK